MILELFVTTTKEYKRFADQLPLKYSDTLFEQFNEFEYVSVQVRLMLLRKYISKSKNNNMYFEYVIDEACNLFPQDSILLGNIKSKFIDVHNNSFEHILSDGTILNIYESIEDIVYGLYLHADRNRITRLSRTTESLRLVCTKKYVSEVEPIILEFYNFLIDHNISSRSNMEYTRAPVISLLGGSSSTQEIKSSPFWGNIHGKDVTDEEAELILKSFTKEEEEIFACARIFLEELNKEHLSLSALKQIVFWSTLDQWGDFSVASAAIKEWKNIGTSNYIRFDDDGNVAYVKVFPNVEKTFVIDSLHIVPAMQVLTLIKDIDVNKWKIFALGSPVDPYMKE